MRSVSELKLLQNLPLEAKVLKSKQRIRKWVSYYGTDGVYVAFSGGKDSTVLLHLVRSLYPTVQAVYVDTGMEYPEVRRFAKSFENVVSLRPKMHFDKVIRKYGYPLISKEVSECVHQARKCLSAGGHIFLQATPTKYQFDRYNRLCAQGRYANRKDSRYTNEGRQEAGDYP